MRVSKVQTIEDVDWGHVSGILGRILDDPAPTRYISNPRLIAQLKMLTDFTNSGGFATTKELRNEDSGSNKVTV